jgi:enoyl-[acyl-carrier-protein] reductase (NADH)
MKPNQVNMMLLLGRADESGAGGWVACMHIAGCIYRSKTTGTAGGSMMAVLSPWLPSITGETTMVDHPYALSARA